MRDIAYWLRRMDAPTGFASRTRADLPSASSNPIFTSISSTYMSQQTPRMNLQERLHGAAPEVLSFSALLILLGRRSRQSVYDLMRRDASFPKPRQIGSE